MSRTRFLRPATAVLFLALLPAAAACNGHVIGLGSTGETLQAVSTANATTSATSGSPVVCPAGWAHPNICCTASAGVAVACGEWEQDKFLACAPGATTYPNLDACCDLKDSTSCINATPPGAPIPQPPPVWGCGFACPPGWWTQAAGAVTPAGPEGAMCCATQPSGITECIPQASGATFVSPPVMCGGTVGTAPSGPNGGGPIDAGPPTVDAAPAPPPDASVPPSDDAGVLPGGWSDDGGCGVYDAGSPEYPGYDGGAASLCGACPTGWSADPVQPEVCCQGQSDGTRLCFSQAWGSATSTSGGTNSSGGSASSGGVAVPPSGTGTAPSGWGSGPAGPFDGGPTGPTCSGSDTSCSCNNTVNGHSYALSCTAASAGGAATCTCLVDGTSSGSTTSVDSCQDSTAVESAYSASSGCAFP